MPEPEPKAEPQAGHAADAPGDMRDLAQDWITLWQSELAAMAADRETQENWQRLLALWAQVASAWVSAMPPAPVPANRHDDGLAHPNAAPWPAPAAPAPDPRDAEINRLAERVAELERRISGLGRES